MVFVHEQMGSWRGFSQIIGISFIWRVTWYPNHVQLNNVPSPHQASKNVPLPLSYEASHQYQSSLLKLIVIRYHEWSIYNFTVSTRCEWLQVGTWVVVVRQDPTCVLHVMSMCLSPHYIFLWLHLHPQRKCYAISLQCTQQCFGRYVCKMWCTNECLWQPKSS